MAKTYENLYRRDTVKTPHAVSEVGSGSLGDMTKAELLDEADRRGVDVARSATKAEILDALNG